LDARRKPSYRLLSDDPLGGRSGWASRLLRSHSVGVPCALRGSFLLGGLEPVEDTVTEHLEV